MGEAVVAASDTLLRDVQHSVMQHSVMHGLVQHAERMCCHAVLSPAGLGQPLQLWRL